MDDAKRQLKLERWPPVLPVLGATGLLLTQISKSVFNPFPTLIAVTTNLPPFYFSPLKQEGGKQPFQVPVSTSGWRCQPPGWRAEPLQPIGCNDSARRFRHRSPIRYMHADIYSKHSTAARATAQIMAETTLLALRARVVNIANGKGSMYHVCISVSLPICAPLL